MSAKKSDDIATATRRNMLAHSSVGFGLTALTGVWSTHRSGLVAAEKANPIHPSRTQPQRAKRVIFCFMSGGVSAIDTFDPKPRVTLNHGKSTPALGRPGVFSAQGKLMASPWKFRRRGASGGGTLIASTRGIFSSTSSRGRRPGKRLRCLWTLGIRWRTMRTCCWSPSRSWQHWQRGISGGRGRGARRTLG